MSDKATMEVYSDFVGTVTDTMAEPGNKIRVGQVVMKYSTNGEVPADTLNKSIPVRGELSGLLKVTGNKSTASPVIATPGVEPAAAPSVRHLAREMGIAIEERSFSTEELVAAREAFVSAAGSLVLPVSAVDGRPIGNGGPGVLTAEIRRRYIARLRSS